MDVTFEPLTTVLLELSILPPSIAAGMRRFLDRHGADRPAYRIMAGELGEAEALFFREHVAAINWDEFQIGDMRRFVSWVEFKKWSDAQTSPVYARPLRTQAARELWGFRLIPPGSIVLATEGQTRILGLGIAADGYSYVHRRRYPHVLTLADQWDTSMAGFIPPQGSWGRKTVVPVWLHAEATPESSSAGEGFAEVVDSVGSGQGVGLSGLERKAVERRAVMVAWEHYSAQGYQVTEHGRPFDLLCRRGQESLYVEVKGSTSAAAEVFLTPNEVEWNLRHPDQHALFIVSMIQLDRSVEPATATEGKSRIVHPWQIDLSDLQPKAFTYRVPTDD